MLPYPHTMIVGLILGETNCFAPSITRSKRLPQAVPVTPRIRSCRKSLTTECNDLSPTRSWQAGLPSLSVLGRQQLKPYRVWPGWLIVRFAANLDEPVRSVKASRASVSIGVLNLYGTPTGDAYQLGEQC